MEEIDEAHIHTAFLVVRVLLFFFLFRFLGAATGVLWSSRGFGSPLAISFIDHAYRISITSPLSPLAHCIITSFVRFSVCVLFLLRLLGLLLCTPQLGNGGNS